MSTFTWLIPAPPGPVESSTVAVPQGSVDHVSAGVGRLPEQFKNKTKIVQFLKILLSEYQPIEDALFQLLTQRGIDNAVGVTLDGIGNIVDQPRNGLSDTDYRRYLRAKIFTNRSRGTVEELIRIVQLVVNDDNVNVFVETIGPAAVIVHVQNTIPDSTTQTALLFFLKKAVKAGVRLLVETKSSTEATAYRLAIWCQGQAPGLGTSIGDNFFIVHSDTADILKFPATGSIVIDYGLSTQETRAYNFRGTISGQTFFQLTSGMVFSHQDRCSIVASVTTGLGNSSDSGQPVLVEGSSTIGMSGGRMIKVIS